MSWSNKYIGIPQADLGRTREGVDCWGLLDVVYREELHISLPDYLDYGSPDELEEISTLIDGAKHSPLWVPVTGPAMAFDIALFRRGKFSSHVGIVVRHGLMVHVVGTDQSKLERYDQGRWQHRFDGHWRHRLMADKYPVQSANQRPVQIITGAAK
jgi:probable lipoprotein NlpC